MNLQAESEEGFDENKKGTGLAPGPLKRVDSLRSYRPVESHTRGVIQLER